METFGCTLGQKGGIGKFIAGTAVDGQHPLADVGKWYTYL